MGLGGLGCLSLQGGLGKSWAGRGRGRQREGRVREDGAGTANRRERWAWRLMQYTVRSSIVLYWQLDAIDRAVKRLQRY